MMKIEFQQPNQDPREAAKAKEIIDGLLELYAAVKPKMDSQPDWLKNNLGGNDFRKKLESITILSKAAKSQIKNINY